MPVGPPALNVSPIARIAPPDFGRFKGGGAAGAKGVSRGAGLPGSLSRCLRQCCSPRAAFPRAARYAKFREVSHCKRAVRVRRERDEFAESNASAATGCRRPAYREAGKMVTAGYVCRNDEAPLRVFDSSLPRPADGNGSFDSPDVGSFRGTALLGCGNSTHTGLAPTTDALTSGAGGATLADAASGADEGRTPRRPPGPPSMKREGDAR